MIFYSSYAVNYIDMQESLQHQGRWQYHVLLTVKLTVYNTYRSLVIVMLGGSSALQSPML
jgi:hypothetical protein